MNTTPTQPAAPTAPTPTLRMAVTRPHGEPDAQGYRDSFVTRVGRAYEHGVAEGFNLVFDQTPVLTGDARLLVFAGSKGDKFPEDAPEKLGIFEVSTFTGRDGNKRKSWNRLGTAVLSSGRGSYTLLLNALPGQGKATCIVPNKSTANGAPADPDAAEPGDAGTRTAPAQPAPTGDVAPF